MFQASRLCEIQPCCLCISVRYQLQGNVFRDCPDCSDGRADGQSDANEIEIQSEINNRNKISFYTL